MRIRSKIVLLGLLAVGSLGIVLAGHVATDYERRTVQEKLENAIVRAGLLSNLAHELQSERGRSAIHLATGNEMTMGPLREQWARTDARLAAFPMQFLPGGLADLRQAIASRSVTADDAFARYSSRIRTLLDEMSRTALVSPTPRLKDRLVAHADLVQAKEFLGQLRATTAEALTRPEAGSKAAFAIGARQALFDDSMNRFRRNAAPDDIAAYRVIEDGPAMGRTRAVLNAMLGHGGEAVGLDAWFATATEVIDGLKEIEDRSLDGIRRDAEVMAGETERAGLIRAALLALASMVIVAVGVSTISGLLGSLGQLLRGIASIMETMDFSRRLPHGSTDEIGVISRGFNELLAIGERLIREKDYLATTDALTGVRNRLKFIQVLEAEVLRHQRYGTALSLVMLDIDHFKRVNDTFGHAAGDAVLKQVAGLMARNIRVTDMFARWGGEEFVVLLPGDSSAAALQLAEKLRSAIAGQVVPTVGRVTASFGVAEFQTGDDEASLCHRADEALYQAKHAGRNRVCMVPSTAAMVDDSAKTRARSLVDVRGGVS